MADKVDITDNLDGLNKAIELLMKTSPKTGDEIVTQQSRLFLKNVLALTPPLKGDRGAKSMGTNAVARDIGKAVRLLKPQDFELNKLQKAVRRKEPAKLMQILAFIKGFDDLKDARHTTDIASAHQEQRDSRGRVRRKKPKYFTLDGPAYRAYVSKTKKNVGMAKGGWAFAFLKLGGKPAKWISIHKNQGQMADGRGGKKGQGISFLLMTNHAPWAREKESARIAKAVLRNRRRAVLKSIEYKFDRDFDRAAARAEKEAPKQR